MSDLISRQAAIDALRYAQHRFTVADEAGGMGTVKWSEDVIYFAAAKRVLDELPSAQPEQRWIPCSERLPEVYKDVLICWDFKGNREVLIGNMYSDGTFHGYDDEYLTHNGRKYRKAVAWMPLPEPYREERTEE